MSRFFNSRLNHLAPYVPGEQPRNTARLIKLNTNENPYPPGAKVQEALAGAGCDQLRLYPDPDTTALIEAAAQVYGVKSSQVLPGNGRLLAKTAYAFRISAMVSTRYGQGCMEIILLQFPCGRICRLPLTIMLANGER